MKHGQLQINELTDIITEHFQRNKARIACFVGMLIDLMVAGIANLTQLAQVFPWPGTDFMTLPTDTATFSDHWLDYNEVAHFIMKLSVFTEKNYLP